MFVFVVALFLVISFQNLIYTHLDVAASKNPLHLQPHINPGNIVWLRSTWYGPNINVSTLMNMTKIEAKRKIQKLLHSMNIKCRKNALSLGAKMNLSIPPNGLFVIFPIFLCIH